MAFLGNSVLILLGCVLCVAMAGCSATATRQDEVRDTQHEAHGPWVIWENSNSWNFLLNVQTGESMLLDPDNPRNPLWRPIKVVGLQVSEVLVARLKTHSTSNAKPTGIRVADDWDWTEVGILAGDVITNAAYTAKGFARGSSTESVGRLDSLIDEARKRGAQYVQLMVQRGDQTVQVTIWLRLDME